MSKHPRHFLSTGSLAALFVAFLPLTNALAEEKPTHEQIEETRKINEFLEAMKNAENRAKPVLKLIEKDPENVNLLNGLALIYMADKDLDKALKYARKSLAIEVTDDALRVSSVALTTQSKFDELHQLSPQLEKMKKKDALTIRMLLSTANQTKDHDLFLRIIGYLNEQHLASPKVLRDLKTVSTILQQERAKQQ